ncbi:MAG TPA: HAD family phosphatase [Opitutaceae bacterium]|nr:HAD family phosphatase [Opitutaceae bacterium]
MPYRAILWDNDGVLVDTERWYFHATREVLAGIGIELTETLYFEHFLASSGGIAPLAAARGLGAADLEDLRQRRNALYQAHLEQQPLTIPGVRETLAALRPRFAMGIVTSSRRDHFATIHRRTGLLEFFDFVLTSEDYAESKPAPDPYLAGIARTGFAPSECVAIEDAPRGLAAASAAGIDCWVIPTPLSRRADFSGAKRLLRDVTEIADTLLARSG